MSLLDTIRAHADPDKVRMLEVPEWGRPAELDAAGKIVEPAKPLQVFYTMVTLDELATVHQLDGDKWHHQAARLVAMKAMDAEKRRLFKTIDAEFLRENAAPEVIQGIAMAMLGRITMDDATKN